MAAARLTALMMIGLVLAGCGGESSPSADDQAGIRAEVATLNYSINEAATSGQAPNDQSLASYLEQASDEMARKIEDNNWLGDDEVQGVVDEAIHAVTRAGCTPCADRLREVSPE